MAKMVSQDRELSESLVVGQTSIPTSYAERHVLRQSYKTKETQAPRTKSRAKPWGMRHAVASETSGN